MSDSRLIRTANSGLSCRSAICWLKISTSRNRRLSRSRARRNRCPADSIFSRSFPVIAPGARSNEARGARKGNYSVTAVRDQQNTREFCSEFGTRLPSRSGKGQKPRRPFPMTDFGRAAASIIIVVLQAEINQNSGVILRPPVLLYPPSFVSCNLSDFCRFRLCNADKLVMNVSLGRRIRPRKAIWSILVCDRGRRFP